MKNKLAYFISKSSMFGIGFLILIQTNGKNAYLSIILGTLLGILIIYFYGLFKKKKIDNKLYKFLITFFSIFLICTYLMILSIFINSFYLVNTPRIFVLIPFILVSLLLINKDIKILFNLSNLFYFISIFFVLLFGSFLIKYIDMNNLKPFLNFKSIDIINGALMYASITSIPLILIVDYYDSTKDIIKDYFIAANINYIILMAITLTFGDSLMKMYTYPEYASLKQIKMFNFIENIENISTFGWYTEIFMFISLLTRKIKENIPFKFSNIYLIIILLSSIFLIDYLIGNHYHFFLLVYKYYHFILISFFLLFLIIYLLPKKRILGK